MKAYDSFFRDKHGKLVIWQMPGVPLWGWIIFSALAMVIRHGNLHDGFAHMAQASLIVWSYLEIRSGDSPFRQVLGGVILANIIWSFFR